MRAALVAVLVCALISQTLVAQSLAAPPKNNYSKNYAKQQKKAAVARQVQQKKAAVAQRAQQEKNDKAAKAEAKKRAADPAYAAAQTAKEKQQRDMRNAAGLLILGGIAAGLALGAGNNSGGGSSGYDTSEQDRDRQRQMNKQYWADRAQREASAGNFDEAARSAEMAK